LQKLDNWMKLNKLTIDYVISNKNLKNYKYKLEKIFGGTKFENC